jgi:ribonuclease G
MMMLHRCSKRFDISRQVKTAFGKTVTLKSGAYVILEHTEALHVIDVNSGPKVKKDIAQDTLAFNINVEAAQEIARQLRLRDIGGIIVIDFIDMKAAEYKHKLYEAMLEAMKPDKAQTCYITCQQIRFDGNHASAHERAGSGRYARAVIACKQ